MRVISEYRLGHPELLNDGDLGKAIAFLENAKSQCDDAVVYLQRKGLWTYFSITSLIDAEADILNPENPHQEYGETFSLEYFLKVREYRGQGLDSIKTRELAEPLFRDREYYKRMKDSMSE